VNYYERHIGDYTRDTAHLSLLEHGAYCRLLDVYYAREAPLQASQVHRLVGARTPQERRACDAVLKEFFQLDQGHWRHARCDAEIEKFASGAPDREAKQANRELRYKRHRRERSDMFRRLHAVGQHADWNIPIKDLRALVERYCDGEAVAGVAGAVAGATAPQTPVTATQSHSPFPSTQTPVPSTQSITSERARAGNGASPATADLGAEAWRDAGCDPEAMQAWIDHRAKSGKPLPPHACIHAAQILRGMGDADIQRQAIKTAIANNWQSLRVADGQQAPSPKTRKSMTERLAALGPDDEPEAQIA
jgi:uncharacterized protein YdaU (DUF1376 family)